MNLENTQRDIADEQSRNASFDPLMLPAPPADYGDVRCNTNPKIAPVYTAICHSDGLRAAAFCAVCGKWFKYTTFRYSALADHLQTVSHKRNLEGPFTPRPPAKRPRPAARTVTTHTPQTGSPSLMLTSPSYEVVPDDVKYGFQVSLYELFAHAAIPARVLQYPQLSLVLMFSLLWPTTLPT